MILRLAAFAFLAQNSIALAQDAVNEKASADAKAPAAEDSAKEDDSPWSASLDLKYRTDTKNEKDQQYKRLLSGGGSVSYDIKDIGAVSLSMHGNKDLNREYRWTLTEATLDFGRSFTLLEGQEKGKGLKLGLDVSYGAPVAKDLIKYSNSKGELGAAVDLSYAFEGALSGFRVTYGWAYGRYLYQYDDTNGGTILTKWALTQSYGISYAYEKYSIAANFSNSTSYDFHSNKEDDSFNHVETLGYKIDDHWAVSAGHINNGNTYDYGGKANNVKFYDKYASQVFIGGSYGF